MDLVFTVDGPAGTDELRSLHRTLSREPDLRGLVRLRQRPPAGESLGPVVEAVEVELAPDGPLTVVAGAVLVWLRHRHGSVKVKVTRGADAVEVAAQRIRDLDAASVRHLATEIVTALDGKAQRQS
ncbi:effector-associated constant component EACC1 [Saccharothrix australiensis]|uniref:Uncharacterized protein n=1 Tax=Saccharothrix australiensis TaxID=2072 RepID=A0A495VVW8_9PSEU|nr:hypothetical protein [Saccharothrix australiensis]RKT53522.1 hypothetical protein C8E97_2087 [Saccharothrix australiensis]